MISKSFFSVAACTSALLLTACGGGGGETPAKVNITAVKTAGDSLLDVGALQGLDPSDNKGLGNGRIFSIQSSADEPYVIWSERIARNLGLAKLCSYYSATALATFTTKDECSSFAVGRSAINPTNLELGNGASPTSAYSITQQLTAMGNKGFTGSELVLIDGGGNDAADLIKAYLAVSNDSGGTFSTLTKSLGGTSATEIDAVLTNGTESTKRATAGTMYMQALADYFYASIKTNLLNKGVKQIAILNVPKVTATVQFTQTYALLKSAKGLTDAQISSLDTMFNGWVNAFNTRLNEKVTGDSRIRIVDFYTAFEDQIRQPAQFGLTNVTKTACPGTQGLSGSYSYTLGTCTPTYLSANIPAGETKPDWWKTYAFADNFHPTPYGHQLISQLVSLSLARAGWIQ